jgi:hypothetical protein
VLRFLKAQALKQPSENLRLLRERALTAAQRHGFSTTRFPLAQHFFRHRDTKSFIPAVDGLWVGALVLLS